MSLRLTQYLFFILPLCMTFATAISAQSYQKDATSNFNALGGKPTEQIGDNLNVLFIAVDDLRPEIGAYGVDTIKTPNIDQLARSGTRFTRAYAQLAGCHASRTSVMTGLRPDTTRVTGNSGSRFGPHFRTTVPSVVTIPQWFEAHGYQTRGICKIYHDRTMDDAQSWTLPSLRAAGPPAPKGPDGKPLAVAAVNLPESRFGDYRCADHAIKTLTELRDKPFFLAVGFSKPHLPFLAPPKYFQMYNKNAIPLASNPYRARGAPTFAFNNGGIRTTYSGLSKTGILSDSISRDLTHGYYAATSFVDAQIGRVLAQLEKLGLSNKTVVVLWGDHGFHLGEQGDWGKFTNFDVATRVPLIIASPGISGNRSTDALAELVDVYPTIAELAGLPIPTTQQHGGYPLEGDSLVEFIQNPSSASQRGAFSQIRAGTQHIGHSIRTDRYRFTEWVKAGRRNVYELYDHAVDPLETRNVVADPWYANIIPDLKAALGAGGRQDLPASLR